MLGKIGGGNLPQPKLDLKTLASKTEASRQKAQRKMQSWRGRAVRRLPFKGDSPPTWAIQHIQNHQELKARVIELSSRSGEDSIPEDVQRILRQSQEVVLKVSTILKSDDYLPLVQGAEAPVDRQHLLSGPVPRDRSASSGEWRLNLGLMMNVYDQTRDPKLKKRIAFLACNYLAKTAPVDFFELLPKFRMDKERKGPEVYLESVFLQGFFQELGYHRVDGGGLECRMRNKLRELFPHDSPFGGVPDSWALDSPDLDPLLPLFFQPLEVRHPEPGDLHFTLTMLASSWQTSFCKTMEDHIVSHRDQPLSEALKLPFCLNMTELLGDTLITRGDPSAEKSFSHALTLIREQVDAAIHQTVTTLGEKYPNRFGSEKERETLTLFLRWNMAAFSTAEVQDTTVLTPIPLYTTDDYLLPEDLVRFSGREGWGESTLNQTIQSGNPSMYLARKIGEMINLTGLRLGAVRSRERIFDLLDPLLVLGRGQETNRYAVKGPNPVVYPSPQSVLEPGFLRSFRSALEDPDWAEQRPNVIILGESALDLVEGLFSEISKETWDALNENQDTRMLLQQTLVRLMVHLAGAANTQNNFIEFSNNIELVHADLAALLTITHPFPEDAFEEIYTNHLASIPPSLQDLNIRAGVAKSAMNAFSGVAAAVQRSSGKLETASANEVYYEASHLIGPGRTVPEILADASSPPINLYLGEFHHNISVHRNTHHYERTDIIKDVRQILDQSGGSHPLTVAIDATIDFANSPDLKELMETFEPEIKGGFLNLVCFHSGQKFDMLGTDQYYGAPFWLINDGSPHWEAFEDLLTHDTFQSDPLSKQWFCLVNKHAPWAIDAYKEQFFAEGAKLNSRIPDDFKEGGRYADRIRISTVESDMLCGFLDIKLIGSKPGPLEGKLKHRLFERFQDAGSKFQHRNSFGFVFPNYNLIMADEALHIRINPGLDALDSQILIDFMENDLQAILEA